MDVNDILNFHMKLADSVNYHWHIYTIIIMALLGWMLSAKKTVSFQLKLLITFGLILFSLIDITGLLRSYAFLEATTFELQAIADDISFKTTGLTELVSALSYGNYRYKVWGVFSTVDLGVLITLWRTDISKIIRKKVAVAE